MGRSISMVLDDAVGVRIAARKYLPRDERRSLPEPP
jgi:hypothetical protein